MSTFTQYLAESSKSYDYKVKVAGDISDDFASRMETALAKFEVAKMSAGKKTPIMTMPLDFPALSNESVTIFDITTNYPVTTNVMKEYLSDYMNINASMIVVRKPGEPTEQYQDEMAVAGKSEYANKLMDIEMKDSPEIKAEEFFGDKYNMGLLRELMKSKIDQGLDKTEQTQDMGPTEVDTKTGSPIHTGPGPVKGNPHPATLQGFKQ